MKGLRIAFWLAVALLAGQVLWTQFAGWNDAFLATCPNKDSLVWDGNMRFLQAIDIVDDARRGVILPGIGTLLASPTWPPSRTLFSIVLLIWNGSPDPVLDGRPSVFFFFAMAVLLFAFAFFYGKESKGKASNRSKNESKKGENKRALTGPITPSNEALQPYFNGMLVLTVLFLLSGIIDLPEFLFSSMLEVQGMFFFTWNAWTVLLILRRIDAEASGESAEPITKALLWSFAFSGAGLYLTKYPFGILSGAALLFLSILRNPGRFAAAVLRLLRERYTGWHLIPLGLLAAALLIIVLGPHLGSAVVNTKGVKRFLYVAVVIVFIDFNVYLYRQRPDFFSKELRIFYLYFLLPFVFLLLSHPDRFGSLVQAQTDRVPGGSRFYPSAIFSEYFVAQGTLAAVVLGGLASGFVAFVFSLRNASTASVNESSSARRVDGDTGPQPAWMRFLPPTTAISLEWQMIFFVWANIFVMQFMTSNHQARYLFQIFPLFLFFHGSLFWTLGRSLPVSSLLRQSVPLLMIAPLPLMALRPLLAEAAPETRNVCFATTDPAPIDAARRIAAHVPASTDAILLNDFHEPASPDYGRRQATEIDLFLRYRTYGIGRVRTDSRFRYPTWTDGAGLPAFAELIHITYLCNEKSEEGRARAAERAAKADVQLAAQPIDAYNDPDGLCMRRYKLLPLQE